ncbi:MAG: hypothetical protein J7K87_02045 [Candidatus Aenigmarchaeota archaeon]|nr:hypothetical protein [Candidatus Aenigmarchaeota archaeon]
MRKLSEDMIMLANEIGLTEELIQKGVEQTLRIAKEKELDLSENVLVGFDMNGPMTATWDASLRPRPGVPKGVLTLHGIPKTILSGWDITTIENFLYKKMGFEDMNNFFIVGELGAVYKHKGETIEPNPVPEEDVIKLWHNIFEGVAEENLKIAVQGNISSSVGDIYMEAESPSRGNLQDHFLVKNKDVWTRDIYNSLGDGFEYKDGKIEFKPTDENVKKLYEVLSRKYTLQSVRFEKKGEKLYLWRDKNDKEDFNLKEMEKIARKIIPDEWEIDPNNDYCVDFKRKSIEIDKEYTANLLAKKIFQEKDYVITNVGDKPGDILRGENTINYPQFGTKAQVYCEKEGIPHIPVVHAGDYSMILAEAIRISKGG